MCIFDSTDPMEHINRYHFKTISEYHKLAGLPKPGHPLVSVVNMQEVKMPMTGGRVSMIYDFYSIALKRVPDAQIKYGQQISDFDDGVLFFMAPGQVFTVEIAENREHRPTGWMILFHADLLWGTHLAKMLKSLIGQSTQQYLHEKLIGLAKEKLSTTNLSVSEISYELGFEHLQSFSRLFKIKTNLSPKEFRESFNK